MTNLLEVNWNEIPAPQNDGAATPLKGTDVAATRLMGTHGNFVDLSKVSGRNIVYAYPMTGRPDVSLPYGWDMMPGARGCTLQACAFRDHAQELNNLGVFNVFGLSTQETDYQREAADRLHLPFPLLSDARLEFVVAMKLPTSDVDGMTLLKRLTMVIDDGTVTHVFYPVFPPDQNAQAVINWLNGSTESSGTGYEGVGTR